MNLSKFYDYIKSHNVAVFNIDTGEFNIKGFAVPINSSENFDSFSLQDLLNYVKNNSNISDYLIAYKKDNIVTLGFYRIFNNKQEALLEAFKNNIFYIFDIDKQKEIKFPKPQISGTMHQNHSYMMQWISKQ